MDMHAGALHYIHDKHVQTRNMYIQHQAGIQEESGQQGVTMYLHVVHSANQETLQLPKSIKGR